MAYFRDGEWRLSPQDYRKRRERESLDYQRRDWIRHNRRERRRMTCEKRGILRAGYYNRDGIPVVDELAIHLNHLETSRARLLRQVKDTLIFVRTGRWQPDTRLSGDLNEARMWLDKINTDIRIYRAILRGMEMRYG